MSKIHFTVLFLLSFLTATAQSWTHLVSGTSKNLHDVAIAPNQTVYAITSAFYGDNNWVYNDILLRSFDNGNTWDSMEIAGIFAKDVFFLNDSVGFISGGMPSCGIAATVAKTTNKGTTWDGFNTQSVWSAPISVGMGYSAAYFWQADKGYILGGNWGAEQYKTADNGATWTNVSHFTSNQSFPDLFFWNEMEGYVISDSVNVSYDSLGNVISSATFAYIHKTTDGGLTWTKQVFSNDSITDIHFPSQNIGYVTAGSHLLKTTDGGITWQSSNLPFVSRKVAFWDNNIGYVVTADGDIYKTNNGGTTWLLDASGDFLAIEIKNGQGFAVGKNGSISRLRTASNAIAEAVSAAPFQVFPNPVGDILNIVSAKNVPFSVEIYNALGQLVLTGDGNHSLDLRINSLAQETYFLYIKDEKGQVLQTEKVVKN